MGLLPEYIHIVNPKLKHIYLSFDEKGSLVIKSPRVSSSHIEKLLLSKREWINKSRKKIEEKKGKALDFSTDSRLYFMGESYPVVYCLHKKKRTRLEFNGSAFSLNHSVFDTEDFQKKIDKFYKEEALKYVLPYVGAWAKTMGLGLKKVSFRKTKRQWGSCSAKNDLSFNTMMMKLPKDVIQYIIVHELAHMKHKHHQKSFWDLVQKYLPEYKVQVEELKKYTT